MKRKSSEGIIITTELKNDSRKVGAPTLYDEEKLRIARDFVDLHMQEGTMPYLQDLNPKLGVHRETVLNWTKTYPEFFDVIKRLEELQEKRLVHGGLTGQLHPTMSIFLLKTKHGYIETEKIQHEHSGEIEHTHKVVMLPERDIINGNVKSEHSLEATSGADSGS